MGGSIVWVSGATGGLGLGIARHVPYRDCRVINISRRRHPDFETVIADFAAADGWDTARRHFRQELAGFKGERAIFIHNSYDMNCVGLLGTVEARAYQNAVVTNSAAPLILGEAFLSAAAHLECEVGLALVSSGAAVSLIEGLSTYSAAKIGVEHWAQIVHAELASRGAKNRWVVAYRPGGIDSPGARRNAEIPKEQWPFVEVRKEMHASFMDIDTAGRRFWSGLPPAPDAYLLSVGAPPEAPAPNPFGGQIDYVS